MTTRLSIQNWDELWDECIHEGSITRRSDNGDRIEQGYLGDLCQVYERQVRLPNGLKLRIYSCEPVERLIINYPQPRFGSSFILSFFVTGNVNTTLHPIANNVEECPGKNYLCRIWGEQETEEWQAGQKILRVQVYVQPQDLLATFGRELVEQLSPDLQSLITGTKPQSYYYLGTTTLQMHQAVQQILNCPYQGLLKQMYLESKALELVTLRFAQFMEDSRQAGSKTRLQEEDIDRIHWAKDILTDSIINPPSLMELARLVGMNDCKLKQGFRQVFGTTAFGYLYEQRMEYARQFLLTRELSVAQVAEKVGYASPSRFARAFRKKFGVNPKVFMKEL